LTGTTTLTELCPFPVVGVDDRVGSVALGLRREGLHEPAHNQANQWQYQQEKPRTLREVPACLSRLAVARNLETHDIVEDNRADPVHSPGEEGTTEPGDHPHEQGEDQPAPEIVKIHPVRETGETPDPRLCD